MTDLPPDDHQDDHPDQLPDNPPSGPAGAGMDRWGTEEVDADEDWAAALADAVRNASGRTLSQPEIDRLMGPAPAPEPARTPAAAVIDRIVNASFANYERLPMLDVVFDRLVRLLNTSIRNMTSGNVEVTIEESVSGRFGDFIGGVPLPSLVAVVKAEQWDSSALMCIDSALIYALVDVLLGGRRSEPAPIDGRPYTLIERALSDRLIRIVLRDLAAAFAPLTDVSFALERTETNPLFAVIARNTSAAIKTRMRVELEDRCGAITLVVPYAALEPVRGLLLQMFMGEKFGRDAMWEGHLKAELKRTHVGLSAVLGRVQTTLADIMAWTAGTQLVLDAKADSPALLVCGSVPMFVGEIGQRDGRIAVKIRKDLGGQQEVLETLDPATAPMGETHAAA